MAKYKKQHYISEFYLKGFLEPTEKTHFWMYDMKSDTVKSVSTGDAGAQTYYYAFEKIDGTMNRDTFEKGFQIIEDVVAPSIKKILLNKPYNNMERGHISTFMAASMVRVPSFRDAIKKNIETKHKERAMSMARNKELFMKEMRDLEKEHGENLGNLDDLREDFLEGKYHIEIDPYQSLGIMNNSMIPLAETLHGLYWHFLIAPHNRKFITCDNPLFYINPQKKLLEQDETGLWTEGTEITFPLSRNIAIFATIKIKADAYVNVNASRVDEINRRTIISANRFVFAGKQSKQIERYVKKYKQTRPVFIEKYFPTNNGFLTKSTRQIIISEPT